MTALDPREELAQRLGLASVPPVRFESPAEVLQLLAAHDYLADDAIASVVYLADRGYTWMKEIIAHVLTHGECAGLVEQGLIDAEDLEGAELALEAGCGSIPYDDRRWRRNDVPWAMVVPPELDPMDGTGVDPVAGDGTEPEPRDGDWEWDAPGEAPDEAITRAPGYLLRLRPIARIYALGHHV